MRAGRIGRYALCSTVLTAALLGTAFGAEQGDWALSEDGKRWMFCYSPDEPVKDEWIEIDGKEYYLDASGYMKTGWVKDKNDDKTYYMGEDGAKCFYTFAEDGSYVGSDGTAVEAFDDYRKAVKKELDKILKESSVKENISQNIFPGITTQDLNGDGYRDLAVVLCQERADQLLLVAVWDPEDGELKLSYEADAENQPGERSALYRDEGGSTWLQAEALDETSFCYFNLGDSSPEFDNEWNFTIELDDWDAPEFKINGEVTDREEWESFLTQIKGEAAGQILTDYSPFSKETRDAVVDYAPTEEELLLWES